MSTQAQPEPPRRISLAVMLVSAALIIFQVSFTRLIGYRLFYHYVFWAIALSLFGLSAAGTYVALRPLERPLDRAIRVWLLALLIAIPVSLLFMGQPLIFGKDGAHAIKLIGKQALQYLAWCSVFMVALNFIGGVILARIFSAYSERMGRLYSRDLIGAGLGCLLCAALMKWLSPPLAFLFSTFLVLISLIPFRQDRDRVLMISAIGALAMTLLIGFGPASLRNFEGFGITDPRPVVKLEWNHLIRTEQRGREYVLDGSAGTPMVVWDEEEKQRPLEDPAYVVARPHPRVGIIGSGGGPQVAEALRANAEKIVAVDINTTIAKWVLGEDSQGNHGLFHQPSVEMVIGEGRHVFRSRHEKFDVLQMHAIDTYAATAAGAYALTENFLYTKEAFSDWWDALDDGGVMNIRRWLLKPPRENIRLFVTAIDALEELGVPSPEKHLAVIAPIPDWTILEGGQHRVWGIFLFFKNPLEGERLAKLKAHVEAKNWSFLYAPGLGVDTPFTEYATTSDREAFLANYPYYIATVTDASPYFFQFYNPLHRNTYSRASWETNWFYQGSSITLLAALIASVLLSVAIILLPLWWARRRSPAQSFSLEGREVVYFVCLGIGFMALEVPMVQVLSLYLGHPTYGFSVVLVALLVSSGAGSLLADSVRISRARICALIAAILVVFALAIFPLVRATIAWPDPVRFALALLLVVIYGLPMGFPLALAVKELGRKEPRNVAWAWAVNGSASVVASCLIMIVMVFFGTKQALFFGVAAYALAAFASQFARAEVAGERGIT